MDTDARSVAPSRTDTTLAADPDEVWEVLTSPEGVEGWLGEGSTLPPAEGADLDVADVGEDDVARTLDAGLVVC